MTKLLLVALTCLTTNIFGQTPVTRPNTNDGIIYKSAVNDTTPQVVYLNKTSDTKAPAYFLNGKFANPTLLGAISPDLIEKFDVANRDTLINGAKYYGQIFIITKNNYHPTLISLTTLKEKYTNLKDKPVIFMIDGNMVNGDYDKYQVDEKYVLTITIDKVTIAKEQIELQLIQLVTRSTENLKKAKDIMIRGKEVANVQTP